MCRRTFSAAPGHEGVPGSAREAHWCRGCSEITNAAPQSRCDPSDPRNLWCHPAPARIRSPLVAVRAAGSPNGDGGFTPPSPDACGMRATPPAFPTDVNAYPRAQGGCSAACAATAASHRPCSPVAAPSHKGPTAYGVRSTPLAASVASARLDMAMAGLMRRRPVPPSVTASNKRSAPLVFARGVEPHGAAPRASGTPLGRSRNADD